MAIEPLAWKDRPSLIEYILPAQKMSAEAQKERKAVHAQILTSLGGYWKGRKPLVLVKACLLGVLLPTTEDLEADLTIFEMLMAIDDASLVRRLKSQKDAKKLSELSYVDKLAITKRPDECDEKVLYEPIWDYINAHLGTSASTLPQLVQQLGILRFGQHPIVGDPFCGGGSIPFEAARLGCDVYASDLNPIACMLAWGALHIINADTPYRQEVASAQNELAAIVDATIASLQVEHDEFGNRAKSYLYCLEVRCPQTGWMIPMAPSWVISKSRNTIARLVPNERTRSFEIEIVTGVTDREMSVAEKGTIQNDELVYSLSGETYRTPLKTIRGDYRLSDGTSGNKLRRWEKCDFTPRPEDVFQERLYAIHWIKRETLAMSRQESFFASVSEADLEREQRVKDIVTANLSQWQKDGLVPDMPIDPGDETTRLTRERGWTYWHHLFSPRQLLIGSIYQQHKTHVVADLIFAASLDYSSKLCQWLSVKGGKTGGPIDLPNHVFYNQAFNTFYNWGERSAHFLTSSCFKRKIRHTNACRPSHKDIKTCPAEEVNRVCHVYITDPPYADAVQYHEITEFFLSWLRRNHSAPFKEWLWDSRRALAIRGRGDDFRRGMISAYRAMAEHMPDYGVQIVMFTHQDAGVWADMTSIVWGAGLKVTAAWYIATETSSELKKGGYVQGTVLLVVRKRLADEATYRDELVEEVREEVARQIETMVGLNQKIKGDGRAENLFEDADLQMAGYAAALRVLTGYRRIDGQDMAAEALRPRQKGERDIVKEIIDYAVTIANEHLVPEGIPTNVWERCSGAERFYVKMLDMEAVGLKKLDNYQNFAKAFRVADYGSLMGSVKANDARLKNAIDFKKAGFEGDFGKSPLRALLFALYELQREIDSDEVMAHLRDLVPGYLTRRDDLMALCQFIATKREKTFPDEAAAARILFARIKNERLGG